MKIQSLSLFFVMAASSSSFASLPVSVPGRVPVVSVKELLSMPEQNRNLLAQTQKKNESFLSELQTLAFQKDESFQTRWKALTLFSQMKGEESHSTVMKACDSTEWFMKNACLVILSGSNPKLAKTKAAEFLKNKALVVRSQAVRTLAQQMDASGRDLLWEQLDQPMNFRSQQSLWIRGQIIEALSSKPESREMPLFAKALRDKDSRLHFFAIRALESISGKKMGQAKSSIADQRELWMKELK